MVSVLISHFQLTNLWIPECHAMRNYILFVSPLFNVDYLSGWNVNLSIQKTRFFVRQHFVCLVPPSYRKKINFESQWFAKNWNANFKQRQNEYKMSKPIFKATISTTLFITKVPWLNWENVEWHFVENGKESHHQN